MVAMDTEPPVCRICLEEEEEVTSLVDPCECSGTQQWVHPACLQTWRRQIGLPKASRCQVCRAKYDIPFGPPSNDRDSRHMLSILLVLCGAAVCFWFRSFLLAFPLALLWGYGMARGSLSLIAFPGGRLGFIRQGDPVPDLDAGVFLLATDCMRPGSIFYKSVILMLDHDPALGSRGVVLNVRRSPGRVAYRGGDAQIAVGGPVSSSDVWTIVHNRPQGITNSDRVVEGVYAVRAHGHHEMLQLLTQLSEMEGARWRVLVGYAGWAPRQLDGEVRSGSWEICTNITPEDVFGDEPDQEMNDLHDKLFERLAQE
eukprot:TRINITY_DN2921_c0_g1_i2.p1 TRINITY_DN2921_c0_g1~~TRINITY_DN2921_c0_g1_i2.p1  ORF type:complete len:313 (+),score=41.82 TRINITY_DN2921_c0_g1_i2:186-1124(+)